MASKEWTYIGYTAWQKGSYLGDIIMIEKRYLDVPISHVVVKIINPNNSNKQRKEISKRFMAIGTAIKFAKSYMRSH